MRHIQTIQKLFATKIRKSVHFVEVPWTDPSGPGHCVYHSITLEFSQEYIFFVFSQSIKNVLPRKEQMSLNLGRCGEISENLILNTASSAFWDDE